MPIRAFIAIQIPSTPPLRKAIAELGDMGKPIKSVGADRLHVTLKFFGDIDVKSVPEISAVVSQVASAHAAFNLAVARTGAFPSAARPSVVWAGLDDGGTLSRIVAELEAGLAPLGYAPEQRKFQPHLTLARIKFKPPAALGEWLVKHAETKFGEATIGGVELLQSDLGPAGPRYTVLSTGQLQAE